MTVSNERLLKLRKNPVDRDSFSSFVQYGYCEAAFKKIGRWSKDIKTLLTLSQTSLAFYLSAVEVF